MFTNNSKILMKYVDSMINPNKKSNKKSRSKKKTKKKSKKQIKIHKEYRELYNFFKSINTDFKITSNLKSVINKSSSLNIDSPFISENISEEIKSMEGKETIVLKTNKSNININIFYQNEDLTKFKKIIFYALAFIFNLSNHSVLDCTINYYLSDKKKNMECDKDYSVHEFSTNEVNSGSCNGGTNTINIWRKEEILKVTLHECIHLLDYDEKSEDYLLKENYKKKYKITSDSMNIFEAYTEIWAELINIYLTNIIINGNITSFTKFIEYEKFFSHYQASKIFYIKSLNNKYTDINKHTNVLPYYIIKCEIFNNLRIFLNYCRNHENNINYVKIKKNFKKFLDGLEECKKNDKLFYNIDKNSYRYLTMRMTCIELELFS
jgi:hypothetical protein